MKCKYNVGDKVRVLDGTGVFDYFGGWATGMNRYVGKILPILTKVEGRLKNGYKLDGGGGFTYDESFLSPVKEKSAKPRIVVYIDKEDSSVVVAKDTETGKTGKAKCSPEDTFDFYTGAQLAMMRLFDTKPFPEESKKRGLRVGDYVIGNEKASRYGITREGTIRKICEPLYGELKRGEIYIKGPNETSGFCVAEEAFDLYNGPLYTGDIVCIKSNGFKFKVGQIFHVKSGELDTDRRFNCGYLRSVDDMNLTFNGFYEFVEIIE